MEGLPLLNLIGGAIGYLAKLILLVAVSIGLYKKKNTGTILLFVGVLAIIVGELIGFTITINAGSQGPEAVIHSAGINALISGFSYLLFALGLLSYFLGKVKNL